MLHLTKDMIRDLNTLRSTVRFRLQFHENPDSVEVRKAAKDARKTMPAAEGLYLTHVEVLDEITKITYVDIAAEEGEDDLAVTERAIAEALKKGRPSSPAELAGASELVAENTRLRAELERMKSDTKSPIGRSARAKRTAVASEPE